MTYVEAILICDHIDEQFIRGRELAENERLQAIEKILSMATINAVKKDTLLKVIRWFWDNCVTTQEATP